MGGRKMGKVTKIITTTLSIFTLIVAILIMIFVYETKYKITDVKKYTSSDERYSVSFQMVGEPSWPFGPTTARIKVTKRIYFFNKTIKDFKVIVYDDGANLSDSNCHVEWKDDAVEIILTGSEQSPDKYIVSLLNTSY